MIDRKTVLFCLSQGLVVCLSQCVRVFTSANVLYGCLRVCVCVCVCFFSCVRHTAACTSLKKKKQASFEGSGKSKKKHRGPSYFAGRALPPGRDTLEGIFVSHVCAIEFMWIVLLWVDSTERHLYCCSPFLLLLLLSTTCDRAARIQEMSQVVCLWFCA